MYYGLFFFETFYVIDCVGVVASSVVPNNKMCHIDHSVVMSTM